MKTRKIINILTAALTGILLTIAGPAIHAAEAEPAGYEAVEDLSGSLSSVGSDTLVYVMSHWVVNFKRLYPKVSFRIEAAGSSTAPVALIDGSANFGPMSRLMKDKEIQAFVEKFGHEPTVFRVALDGLAVFVHKDNPIEGLTLAQLDAIYSATRQCGHAGPRRSPQRARRVVRTQHQRQRARERVGHDRPQGPGLLLRRLRCGLHPLGRTRERAGQLHREREPHRLLVQPGPARRRIPAPVPRLALRRRELPDTRASSRSRLGGGGVDRGRRRRGSRTSSPPALKPVRPALPRAQVAERTNPITA